MADTKVIDLAALTVFKQRLDLANAATFARKDGDKILSTNDFTDAEKTKLAGIAESAQVNVIESISVDNVAQSVTNKTVNIDLSGKVDKVTGKQLSTEDYTTAEKNKLAGIAEGAEVNAISTIKVDGTALTVSDKTVNIDLSGKVDKINGKQLSTNDFTDAQKSQLDELSANLSGYQVATDEQVNSMLAQIFGY